MRFSKWAMSDGAIFGAGTLIVLHRLKRVASTWISYALFSIMWPILGWYLILESLPIAMRRYTNQTAFRIFMPQQFLISRLMNRLSLLVNGTVQEMVWMIFICRVLLYELAVWCFGKSDHLTKNAEFSDIRNCLFTLF